MKKMPTIFKRDPENMSRVLPEWHKQCLWVRDGEGVPTRKIDGTCCMIDEEGRLWKRRTVKKGKPTPDEFIFCEADPVTGKSFGWVPVTGEDQWHLEARRMLGFSAYVGTYELIGPKVQGNPEGLSCHVLVAHADTYFYGDILRTFNGLRDWLNGRNIEGLVFQHPDGRMAKIKLRDFGLTRGESG